MDNFWRVQWWYRGKCCGTTTFGSEEAARGFKAALVKRGIRFAIVSRV